jgi:hypothetical protein
MRKSLLILLALLMPVTALAWTLPVPSGLTVNDHLYAYDGSTLANRGSIVVTCATIVPTDNNAALTTTLANKSCLLLNHGSGVDTLKLTETGAVAGQWLVIVNISANAVAFPDDSGVLAGAATTLGELDAATFRYTGSIWVQTSASNN